MPVLFLATGNSHKIDEVRSILGSDFTVLSQRDTNARFDIPETANTFEGNAALKALAWAAYLRTDTCNMNVEFVLADDSGLEVDALQGAPGVHSARFSALDSGAPGNSPDSENNAKLLRLLDPVPDSERSARFRCVLALVPVATPVPAAVIHFSGSCPGRIQRQPAGCGGFGYDPLFIPDGYAASFAELGAEIKNRLSHRARALERLQAWFKHAGQS
jgi:XTP/dITP diphosphohydrolase